MKKSLMSFLLLATAACAPSIEETYDLSATGIDWHEGLAEVKNSGRPVLLFQLLGDFDSPTC